MSRGGTRGVSWGRLGENVTDVKSVQLPDLSAGSLVEHSQRSSRDSIQYIIQTSTPLGTINSVRVILNISNRYALRI